MITRPFFFLSRKFPKFFNLSQRDNGLHALPMAQRQISVFITIHRQRDRTRRRSTREPTMRFIPCAFLSLVLATSPLVAQPAVDLGGVAEKHVMVPMRDGVKLSTYLYFPEGKGPW